MQVRCPHHNFPSPPFLNRGVGAGFGSSCQEVVNAGSVLAAHARGGGGCRWRRNGACRLPCGRCVDDFHEMRHLLASVSRLEEIRLVEIAGQQSVRTTPSSCSGTVDGLQGVAGGADFPAVGTASDDGELKYWRSFLRVGHQVQGHGLPASSAAAPFRPPGHSRRGSRRPARAVMGSPNEREQAISQPGAGRGAGRGRRAVPARRTPTIPMPRSC